jgi:alkylation response protein AidB-like acyl-CoA dehydrogenase
LNHAAVKVFSQHIHPYSYKTAAVNKTLHAFVRTHRTLLLFPALGDLLGVMSYPLTDEQLALKQAAADFAAAEMAPHAAAWDAQALFPVDVIRAAGSLGFCALYMPENTGGLGLSRLSGAVIFEEMARACPSTAAYISIHNMAAWMIASWGTPQLVSETSADITSGKKLLSYCLTEPSSGSDAAALKTRAEKTEGGWRLSGLKAFISGAGATDMLVVMARTGVDGPKGISAFVVDAKADGVSYGRKEEKMGWNSQPTRGISFDNVFVPAHHLLGAEGEGFTIAMKGLNGGRINIAACSLGGAAAALDAATDYMKTRQQFKSPLAGFQALQFRLADMATSLTAARLMVHHAATQLDNGTADAVTACAMAKRYATDACFNIVNDALQLHGGYGYTRDYPIERLLRDLRVHPIVEGTNEIMRVIIARHILGGV